MNGQEREAAIVRLFPLVKTIAQAVCHQVRNVELDDLVGDGAVGLIGAVDGFDPARGLPLERYARRKILYAMLDGMRRGDHLSQRARRVLVRAEHDRFAFALQLGRMPSHMELEQRHPKLRSAQSTAYLRRPLSLDSSSAVETLVAPDWQGDPAFVLCARETERSVSIALERLPQRHRELLGMYYARGFRLADVAERLSLTKQRVAQLRDIALATVREEVLAS
jgi:RNA polymerase sigma factor for flagellar operon FliA